MHAFIMIAPLLLSAAVSATAAATTTMLACPCANPAWCDPIATQGTASGRPEFFGFATITGASSPWRYYDWDVVTTIAWNMDPALMCFAHSKGVRVVLSAGGAPVNGTAQEQAAWVDKQVTAAHASGVVADGINFDFEGPVHGRGDPLNARFVSLVGATRAAFHARVGPHTQVSVDVAHGVGGPDGIDGRAYDYAALGAAADLLFVMSYDTRSQVYAQCIASANTPIGTMALGISEFLAVGVPASKLVIGLPWYGYYASPWTAGRRGRSARSRRCRSAARRAATRPATSATTPTCWRRCATRRWSCAGRSGAMPSCSRPRPSRFCGTLFQIERAALHSYGPDPHSC